MAAGLIEGLELHNSRPVDPDLRQGPGSLIRWSQR